MVPACLPQQAKFPTSESDPTSKRPTSSNGLDFHPRTRLKLQARDNLDTYTTTTAPRTDTCENLAHSNLISSHFTLFNLDLGSEIRISTPERPLRHLNGPEDTPTHTLSRHAVFLSRCYSSGKKVDESRVIGNGYCCCSLRRDGIVGGWEGPSA